MMKRCSSCKQSKPLDEFNRSRKARDGLQCQCRECQRRAQARYAKTAKGKATKRRHDVSRFTRGPGLDRWVEKIAREAEEET